MRGFYSIHPRAWPGLRFRPAEVWVRDPYGSTSPGHAERTRETVREIIPGMTLVTLGHPIDAPPAPSFPQLTVGPLPVPPEEPAPASQPTAAAPLPEYKPGLGRG